MQAKQPWRLTNYNMLSILRAPIPPRANRASDNPVLYEDGASALEFHAAGSDYVLRNTHPPWDDNKPSIVVPPLHYHIKQTEHFKIVSGECHLFKDTDLHPWKTLSADESDGPKTASIPPETYHTIHNASKTKPLVLDVKLTPEGYEAEQRFFRTFFGYVDYCRRAGSAPSIFQLMVFLRAADTPLGLPMPTIWLRIAVSRIFMDAMGWRGKWMLGYEESYEEYFAEKKSL